MLGLVEAAVVGAAAVGLVYLLLRLWGRRPLPGERRVDAATAEELLTASQAAEQLGQSETDVLHRAARAELPCYLVAGENRTKPSAYRFSADELEASQIGSDGE